MRKSYVAPQVVALEVAIEGEVFASSVLSGTSTNGFYTPQGTNTTGLGTSSSSSSSVFNLRSTSTISTSTQSENEIFDDLVSFD